MSDFIVYPKYGRMLMLAIGSFLFVVLGVLFLLVAFIDGVNLFLATVGMITLLFFSFTAVYLIKNLFIRRPALILSTDGLTDQSSYIAPGFLKWEEIMEFQLYHYGGQPFLGIITFDPALVIERNGGFKRVLNKLNKGLVDAQVNIPVKNLACDVDVLVNEITTRWEAKMRKYTAEEIAAFDKRRALKDLDSLG